MRLVDDLRRTITLRRPARRVLSLAPAIAENIAAIDGLPFLVGVSTADSFPSEVTRLPRIGDFGRYAYERILALKPDLAIVEIGKVDAATIANAERKMRCPILVQISRNYDDVPRHLRQLGVALGREKQAEPVARQMEQRLRKVAALPPLKPAPTVFIEVSRTPLYSAGPGSFPDDLIRRAGGVNVVRTADPYPVFSREALVAADPEHYIVAGGGDMSEADTKLPPPFDRLRAARNGNIHRIPADWLFRPTPRLADGLERLARVLRT
ncbi:MAG: ABC transporter substrate-binding protein [Capsulimonadales bacterium]|nr:ABC transporter substrate-binding protein [Capsulimonadales bacterium]